MQWRMQPLSQYLGAVVRAGERGCHARGHAARAGARPAERADVLFFPVHPPVANSSGGGRLWMWPSSCRGVDAWD
jgi:hypothetical protein